MRFTNIAVAATAAAGVASAAGRPSDVSICDYYTKALLKNVTASNEYTLLTLLVNTVVIGNYTTPNVGVSVPGILAPGTVNNTKVNLLPYFNGDLASTNKGGNSGVCVNFLDGGGAAPLKKNMPADNDSSNQYFLMTHLYQLFGSLLGCSTQGMPGFSNYQGQASLYEVHKFMDLNYAQVTYFVEQAGLAAASFGVAKSDIDIVANDLNELFNVRCAPPTTIIKAQGSHRQSICVDPKSCPLAVNATCSNYPTTLMAPSTCPSMTSSMTMSQTMMPTTTSMPSSMMSSMTMTTSTSAPVTSAGAASNGFSFAAVAAGLAAFAL